MQIKHILSSPNLNESLTASGWVRTHRRSKSMAFIELNDGSSLTGLQLVINPELESYTLLAAKLLTGAAIKVIGNLVPSPQGGQAVELQVEVLELVGEVASDYPLQKKGHTLEFLRENLQLRMRSNTFGAVMRIRDEAAAAVHTFFRSRGFLWLHTPIITASDCEGAGEMFRVAHSHSTEKFFGTDAFLTVSGQLEAEVGALALGNVYTFGPTFRAENSNTTRHLSEFWMIEPEIAFADLSVDRDLAGSFVQSVISQMLNNCSEDLKFLHEREWVKEGLQSTLEHLVTTPPVTITYREAIDLLNKATRTFEFPTHYGVDLQSEHERYLTDEVIKGPVFVINYPKDIKAFYMRLNDDGESVAAMDLLVPRLGEIIGGSQREERLTVLEERLKEVGLNPATYSWYLDLRRYGGVPHAGFGLGFERLLMYVTGMQNIRDVIPFPRYPGHCRC
jgi:asparaginyl-tRNA synthetase